MAENKIMLENVKLLLGLADDKQDDLLELIITNTETALGALTGVSDVSKELGYIITEVAIKRYNRLGNEGYQAYSQEGLSITFPQSDFDAYTNILNNYRKRGKVVFVP